MSERRSARPETTLAPSIPMNTQSVTSIVLLTWVITSPSSGVCSNQMSAEKMVPSKASPTNRMKTAIGSSLAMVVTTLTRAACLTPLSTRKWIAHRTAEAPRTACQVLPEPKTGKKWPSVPKMSTA